MSLYSGDAIIRWDNKKELFVVEKSFSVYKKSILYDGTGDNSFRLTIPRGFETDLASIPRWATPIVPKLGHHLQPAIVHDYMYVTKIGGVTKADADKLFYQSMLTMGVRQTRALLMYAAVRAGGKGRWV